jgi:uncharacterized protein
MPHPRIGHVVMQTTPFCNIDCKYCYLPDRRNTARMDASLVRRLAERVAEYQDGSEPVRWYWHAGEPLTVGLDHFRACHDALAEGAPTLAHTFGYHVQTNGILIDDNWAGFFKQHNYGIGVSLDGPVAIHDTNRVTRGGKGTFDKVVAGIKRLQDAGLRPGVLAVVTEASINQPLELLRCFANLGIDSVGFNFEEIEGAHGGSSLKALDTRGELRGRVHHFISEILRERAAHFPHIRLRETDWMLPSIMSGDAVEDWLTRPMMYLTVLADGRVSTFCPELAGQAAGAEFDFPVCRLQDEPLAAFADRVFASKAFTDIQAGVDQCRMSCDYFALCGGGCPSNKFFENGNFASTETLHCRIHNQYTTDAVLDTIIASDVTAISETAAAP